MRKSLYVNNVQKKKEKKRQHTKENWLKVTLSVIMKPLSNKKKKQSLVLVRWGILIFLIVELGKKFDSFF